MNMQAIETTNGNGEALESKGLTLRAFLESPKVKNKLLEVASKFMKPEDLVRLALMALSRQPDLARCSHTSVLRALMDAAALRIAPGGVQGRGYLVPRMNKKTGELECCFDPGWRGLVDIARRSGQIKSIEAQVVYQSDVFHVLLGSDSKIEHRPDIEADNRGPIIAAYAVAKFNDGATQFELLTRADINKIRATSASRKGPWESWEDEMSRKSAVRRLCKYLPFQDPTLERAMAHAVEVDAGERLTIDTELLDEKPQPRAKALAASIAAKAVAEEPEEPDLEPEPPPEPHESASQDPDWEKESSQLKTEIAVWRQDGAKPDVGDAIDKRLDAFEKGAPHELAEDLKRFVAMMSGASKSQKKRVAEQTRQREPGEEG